MAEKPKEVGGSVSKAPYYDPNLRPITPQEYTAGNNPSADKPKGVGDSDKLRSLTREEYLRPLTPEEYRRLGITNVFPVTDVKTISTNNAPQVIKPATQVKTP